MRKNNRWCFLFFVIVVCFLWFLNEIEPLTVADARRGKKIQESEKNNSETNKSSKKKNSSKENKNQEDFKEAKDNAKEQNSKTSNENTENVVKRNFSGRISNSSMEQTENTVMTSYKKDQELQRLLNSGKYTEKNLYVEQNPYGISPLTAIVLFQTKIEYSIKVTVKGKTKAGDITGTISEMKTKHRVPIVGLYAGKSNQVQIQLFNKNKKMVKSINITIKTEKLPKELEKAVIVKKHTKTSAYGLIVVSGFDTPYPFAFDEKGNIRWYMTGVYDTYGYFPLSNNRFILMNGEVCTQTFIKPMSQSVNEMDYMGRVYQTYMVKNGIHHEVIEKTENGNLLVLTNSLEDHCEDCIQEIDRKTGKVIKTLDMRKIFGKKFMDMVDWAHLNTVSYNSKNHCVIVSVRNCNAVVKLNWDTDKIVWVLGDRSLYKGTKLFPYVLKPKGDYFQYQYQQHSAYEILENLDDDKNTIEVMMFDNHFISKRPVDTFDGKKSSFVSIYSINEKKKTAEIWKVFKGVKSKVYSNYCMELEKRRVFFMGGCLKKAWKPGHRKGVIYEFDYASEKILNTYSLKNTFYRAYELKIDWNMGAKKLSKPKNAILGDYYKFQEMSERKSVPWERVTSEKIYCSLVDSFLYVHSENHQISRIEMIGKQKSYFFDLEAQEGGDEKFRYMQFHTVVSLEDLAIDTYKIVVIVNGRRQNTGETVTLS